MNFRQLKDLVAFWLDDLQFGYFTETQVGQWINNALKEVEKLLSASYENWHIKCATTSSVVGQTDYVLPSDFLKVNRVEYILSSANSDKQTLQAITMNQQDLIQSGNSTPEAFFLRRNRIVLFPPPDSIKTLKLFYTFRIPEMTDDLEVPDIPEEYRELIAIIAAMNGFIKDGRDASWLQNKKQEYIDLLRRDAEARVLSTPRMVVSTGDEGFGSLF